MADADDAQDSYQRDLDLIADLAAEAGQIALRYFNKDPQVWMKEGDSPVSEADFAVDTFLKENLLKARPDYGWLSEETDIDDHRLQAQRTFIVDPIDGTRGFINGMSQWCVSIAIVENGRPYAGALDCPVLKEQHLAAAGMGARINGSQCKARVLRDSKEGAPEDGKKTICLTGPRSFQTRFDKDVPHTVVKDPFVPSLAYRIAMVACGQTDVAVARASAKDWDLAAADLIAHEAGAMLTGLDGQPLQYNCQDVRHGALVCAHRTHQNEMLDYVRGAMNNG
ncbi:MAG: 3'(2'),5'-bisphosphate nucleotidase CysQ [Pseudomonadota bacterium]